MRAGKSDCSVRYEPGGGQLSVTVESSVKALFGPAIEAAARRAAAAERVSTGSLAIDDDGALDYVVEARVEAALRRAGARQPNPNPASGARAAGAAARRPNSDPVTGEAARQPNSSSASGPGVPVAGFGAARTERIRTRLYIPGNQPDLLPNASLYGADCLILDLEDSVAPSRKLEARVLLRRVLTAHRRFFAGTALAVRINAIGGDGLADLEELAACLPDIVLVPKCESPSDVTLICEALDRLEGAAGSPAGSTRVMPLIESAKGVLAASAIAGASPRVVGLSFGAEDFSRDIGAARSAAGLESTAARQLILLAAKAAGVEALDSVYPDVDDEEGLAAYCAASKALGFDGVGLIHPRQVAVAARAFAPGPAELAEAARIVAAYDEALRGGVGSVSVDGRMVDAPVAARARRLLAGGDARPTAGADPMAATAGSNASGKGA